MFGDRAGETVLKCYVLQKKIGSGAFGQLYLAQHATNANEHVAVKIESRASSAPQLINEYKCYQRLNNTHGFPRLFGFDSTKADYVLVIELLHKTLKELFETCKSKFSTKTVLYIGMQVISRFETLHDLGLLYRDVKPENFMIGHPPNNARTIYLLDFGLVKEYIDPETKQHVSFKENKPVTGTIRYMSIAGHYKHELARKDDIESVCYMLLFFLRGSLPWSGVLGKIASSQAGDKSRVIGTMKENTNPEQLFEGFPEEFANILK